MVSYSELELCINCIAITVVLLVDLNHISTCNWVCLIMGHVQVKRLSNYFYSLVCHVLLTSILTCFLQYSCVLLCSVQTVLRQRCVKSVSQAISCIQMVAVWLHLNLVTLEGSLVRVQDSLLR